MLSDIKSVMRNVISGLFGYVLPPFGFLSAFLKLSKSLYFELFELTKIGKEILFKVIFVPNFELVGFFFLKMLSDIKSVMRNVISGLFGYVLPPFGFLSAFLKLSKSLYFELFGGLKIGKEILFEVIFVTNFKIERFSIFIKNVK